MGEINLHKIERDTKRIPCAHHWLIESSNGPTSFGICKHCGAVKEFYNDLNTLLYSINHPSDGDNTQRHI